MGLCTSSEPHSAAPGRNLCVGVNILQTKASEGSGPIKEKKTPHLFFLPGFLFTSVAKATSLGSDREVTTEQTAHSLTDRFIEYVHN